MAKKKKSFYFEDYVESEFADSSKPNFVKVSLNRVTFLSFIFFSLILIFSIKIIYQYYFLFFLFSTFTLYISLSAFLIASSSGDSCSKLTLLTPILMDI